MKKSLMAAVLACLFSGCLTDYTWTSNVPQKMRTVAVPTFRNQSDVTELGAAASKQLLREFQREGTFSIRRVGDAAIEVQGTIESCDARAESYDRRGGLRSASYRMGAHRTGIAIGDATERAGTESESALIREHIRGIMEQVVYDIEDDLPEPPDALVIFGPDFHVISSPLAQGDTVTEAGA